MGYRDGHEGQAAMPHTRHPALNPGRMAAISILAYLCAAQASAQPAEPRSGKPPWGRRDPAAYALGKAHEAAMSAPIAEICPQDFAELSKRCMAHDPEKARQLLTRVREWADAQERALKTCRDRRRPAIGTRVPYPVSQATLVTLAETAHSLAPELARDYLATAANWPKILDLRRTGAGFRTAVALRLLDGDQEGAVQIAVAYCEANPKTRERALQALIAFDPDAAAQFAAHFDAKFRAEGLRKVAVVVAGTDLKRSVRYHRLALAAALLIPRDEDPGWRIVCDSVRGIAAADLDAARQLIDELDRALGARAEASAESEAPPVCAGIKRPRQDLRDIRAVTVRAMFCSHPERFRYIEREYGFVPGTDAKASAARHMANRGKVERALKMARSIERASRQAEALTGIADAVAAKTPERALSVYKEAFRLLATDGSLPVFHVSHPIARGIASLAPLEGRDCHLMIAAALADVLRRRDLDGVWHEFSVALIELAKVDPQAAAGVLQCIPSHRYGDDFKVGVVNRNVLPYLAGVEPDMVFGALKELKPSQSAVLTRAVVLAQVDTHPDVAERFMSLISEDADLEAQLRIRRVAEDLLRGRAGVAALLEAFPLQAWVRSVSFHSPLEEVLTRVAEGNANRAIALCHAVEDTRTRDTCLHHLACSVFTDPSRIAALAPSIEDPSLRIATWLRVVTLCEERRN